MCISNPHALSLSVSLTSSTSPSLSQSLPFSPNHPLSHTHTLVYKYTTAALSTHYASKYLHTHTISLALSYTCIMQEVWLIRDTTHLFDTTHSYATSLSRMNATNLFKWINDLFDTPSAGCGLEGMSQVQMHESCQICRNHVAYERVMSYMNEPWHWPSARCVLEGTAGRLTWSPRDPVSVSDRRLCVCVRAWVCVCVRVRVDMFTCVCWQHCTQNPELHAIYRSVVLYTTTDLYLVCNSGVLSVVYRTTSVYNYRSVLYTTTDLYLVCNSGVLSVVLYTTTDL